MKITAIGVQARNKSRVNVSVDGRYRFSLEIQQVAELGLRIGAEFSEEELVALEEESKFGISTDETEGMIRDILDKCPNIRIRGLMCIAPFAENPEDVRVYFAQVKKLYDEYSSIEHKNLDFKYLSMGMSHDYEVAILEGSNLIRVGTAIFGERDYSKKL